MSIIYYSAHSNRSVNFDFKMFYKQNCNMSIDVPCYLCSVVCAQNVGAQTNRKYAEIGKTSKSRVLLFLSSFMHHRRNCEKRRARRLDKKTMEFLVSKSGSSHKLYYMAFDVLSAPPLHYYHSFTGANRNFLLTPPSLMSPTRNL